MVNKWTYRKISLIIGVLVAMIIAFTLWFSQDAEQPSTKSQSGKISFFGIAKIITNNADFKLKLPIRGFPMYDRQSNEALFQ